MTLKVTNDENLSEEFSFTLEISLPEEEPAEEEEVVEEEPEPIE